MGGIISVDVKNTKVKISDSKKLNDATTYDVEILQNMQVQVKDCDEPPPPPKPIKMINHVAILLHPHFIQFLEFKQLSSLCTLNKYYAKTIEGCGVDFGYWQAMCNSLAAHRGLYCPHDLISARDFFFEELWQCNRKWVPDDSEHGQNFKIRVGSRFRPGNRSNQRFALPLHQFLKVRSQQKGACGDAVFVGETTPENYLDPLMGTVMVNPVMLPDSRKIVDRSHVRGEDPFSGTPVRDTDLIPMTELKEEIEAYKKRQFNVDISIGSEDVKGLLEDVDPRLLEAMVAVDQLNCATRRALHDASNAAHQPNLPNVDPQAEGPQVEDDVAGGQQALVNRREVGPASDMANGALNAQHYDASSREDDMDLPDKAAARGGFANCTSRWAKAKNDSAKLIDISKEKATISMNVPGTGVRPFNFNQVFPDRDRQVTVYNEAARDIVISALNGTNGCLLCYGQTGSGKTHTMFGPPDGSNPLSVPDLGTSGQSDTLEELDRICHEDSPTGIVMRACAELLRAKLKLSRRGDVSMMITAQFVEIYNETVSDLMTGNRASIRRASGDVSGALEVPINSLSDAVELLRTGNMRKHFAATEMNDRSSRSHTSLIFHLSQTAASMDMHVKSKLYLVDLAGSERVKKSKAAGVRLQEATAINYSLLVLGKVITRLSRSALHVPYYESQLTTMLKGAFGGNCRTGVVVTCRSDDHLHGDETLQSLRFGETCGMISNSTRQAASSASHVVKCLDEAIVQVSKQMESLRSRGKNNLPSFLSLETKLAELKGKRENIAGAVSPPLSNPVMISNN